MLSRDLLRSVAEVALRSGTGTICITLIQRKVRVGWATAEQLVTALENAGVVGPRRSGWYDVLPDDVEAAHQLVDQAVEAGRIQLDPEDQRQHWPSCTKFDRPVDGHELECGCWCHQKAATVTAPNLPGGEVR